MGAMLRGPGDRCRTTTAVVAGHRTITACLPGRARSRSGTLQPVLPARLVESRPGEETIDGEFEGFGQVAAGSVTRFDVAGRGGVPDGAEAVMLNVTAVFPDAPGFLTVWSCDGDVPVASSVNYAAGDVAPNAVSTALNDDGEACIYSLSATDLIVDVNASTD